LNQGACLEEGVSFFLSRNSAGEGAVRQTTVFAIIWFIIQFGLGLSMTVIFGVEGMRN
jgi:preprotein translocase subunit SecG